MNEHKRRDLPRRRRGQPTFNLSARLRHIPRVLAAGSRPHAERRDRTAALHEPALRYQLGERLGAGGMAEVYRGKMIGAEGFERTVAIKRILPRMSDEPGFVRQFVQEAQVISRLSHPNIVNVLDFHRDARGQLFLVLEFVDGLDLDQLLESGPLPHSVIIFLVSEILSGLAYAHHLPGRDWVRGVVHRDVSPHNVLVSWEGAVKLSDFGLAKPRETSSVSVHAFEGKVAFMSPEQVNRERLDERSDLFSVGVMLWEMLTDKRLFWHEDTNAAIRRVLELQVPRPSTMRHVPRDLENVAMKLLKRKRARRYRTAEAAIEALAACAASSSNGRAELVRLLVERFPQRALRLGGQPVPLRQERRDWRTRTAPSDLLPCRRSRPSTLRRCLRWWWGLVTGVADSLVRGAS